MTQGVFVTFEGGEGSGKSTQVDLLAQALGGVGVEVVTTREPGGAPAAEHIRTLLVEGDADRWTPKSEALLNYAARIEHLRQTIRPALQSGRWVICDRFADSTTAYQGYGHALGSDWVAALHELVVGDLQPDLTIILDMPVETGLKRAEIRGGVDRYERMDVQFHERLRAGFLEIAARNPERCTVIDATGSIENIQTAVRQAVHAKFDVEIA
ncbi:MAG: dTMP kinase [Rhodospirillales bacterium]|jgi:dTMP kinase|nr:dTMP kinase [Rhodospirillales bacterium]